MLFQFPLVHPLFSLVLAVMGARQGIVATAMVTYGTLAAALVFGPACCGWCCDGAAIQECCTALGARRLEGRRFWIKYVVAGIWPQYSNQVHSGPTGGDARQPRK